MVAADGENETCFIINDVVGTAFQAHLASIVEGKDIL